MSGLVAVAVAFAVAGIHDVCSKPQLHDWMMGFFVHGANIEKLDTKNN